MSALGQMGQELFYIPAAAQLAALTALFELGQVVLEGFLRAMEYRQ